MSKSQELGLMELTPRGSRDLAHQHAQFVQHHKKNTASVAPIDSDTKQGSPSYSHSHRDHNGMGHLILEAARNGNPAELEALLRDGANPNVIDSGGRSPLHLALATGKL